MPPRRKSARKSVRKDTPRTPTATASADTEPATETPTGTPVSAADSDMTTNAPVSAADTDTSPKPSAPTETSADTPVSAADADTSPKPSGPTEAATPGPAIAETPAEEPASTETLTLAEEPASITAVTTEPASETLESELAAVAKEPALEVAADPSEPATKRKKVIRVRKVLKKRAVTKTSIPVSDTTDASISEAANTDAFQKPSESTAGKTSAPESASVEFVAEEPASAVLVETEPASTDKTPMPESASTGIVTEEPASTVTVKPEPASEALESESAAPAQEPVPASEPAPRMKKVIRVRKVLKKKIVSDARISASNTGVPTGTPVLASDTGPSPKPSEPTAGETPASEPASMDIVAEEPSSTVTVKPEPASETLETEPAALAEEAVPASESAPKTKKVLRVRKVVKRKIVKKLVPKASLAATVAVAAQEDAKEAQGVVSVPDDVEEVPEKEVEPGTIAYEDAMSERTKRKNTEIFVGGLDRDAKEEDLRKVFGKAGEIVEVRMIMDGQSGKNKGYGFIRYADASMAKKAVTEFEKVEVCGKLCGASALKGNDTIFLGNIDKKWKKEDIIKLLQEIGIEKIDTVTVMVHPNNSDTNRGFAFLELQSNKDAQIAYKKLQKKNAFGKGRNIKVAWAEAVNLPDEEEMKKVKSVYVEGIPSSWDEEKVRETFKKFGEIERVVLARNIKSAKGKDYAFVNYTTREAALFCIESFDKESTDNDSKVMLKVEMAKPVQKGKQNKGGSKSSDKDNIAEKPRAVQHETKAYVSSTKGKSFNGGYTTGGGKNSSTTHELLHVIRQQATLKHGQVGYAGGSTMHEYAHGSGGKRAFSSLGDEALYSDLRGYQRPRLDGSFPYASSSYGAMPHGTAGSFFPYHQHQGGGYAPAARYGATDYTDAHQTRQGAPPYGSSYYPRY